MDDPLQALASPVIRPPGVDIDRVFIYTASINTGIKYTMP